MSFFTRLKNIFSGGNVGRVVDYVGKAYPVVEKIALATPNRTDDEIIAIAHSFGVLAQVNSGKDRGVMLLEIAVQVAQALMPGLPVAGVTRIVEAAYQMYRASAVV